MVLRLIFLTLLGWTAALGGCTGADAKGAETRGQGPVYDQSDEEVEPGSRRLELLSNQSEALAFGEEALLRVVLTRIEDEAVIAGAHVSFAFQGIAQATFEHLDVATDGDGVAENTLTVGEFVGTFTVEISAPGAEPVNINVAVGDAGFGAVIVKAPYTGERQVERRRIAIVPQSTCDDPQPGAGDHMTLLAGDADEGGFLLPAETDYAVVAFALGPQDTVLAWGCTIAAAVEANAETTVVVKFTDHTLEPTGNYELRAELRSVEPATTLAGVLEEAATQRVETMRDGQRMALDADARLLLDALEDLLRTDAYVATGADALADELLAARVPETMPRLEALLQEMLDDAVPATGARVGAALLAQETADNLADMTLLVDITVDGDSETAPLSWAPKSIDVGMLSNGQAGPVIDLGQQGDAEVTARLLAQDDGIDLQEARFSLPWGTLASDIMYAIVEPQMEQRRQPLRQAFGCEVFEAWVADTPMTADQCDAACAQEACELALGRMVEAASAELLLLDEARPTVTLWGQLRLHDDTGDLTVERIDVDDLMGKWNVDTGGTPEHFDGSGTAEMSPPAE